MVQHCQSNCGPKCMIRHFRYLPWTTPACHPSRQHLHTTNGTNGTPENPSPWPFPHHIHLYTHWHQLLLLCLGVPYVSCLQYLSWSIMCRELASPLQPEPFGRTLDRPWPPNWVYPEEPTQGYHIQPWGCFCETLCWHRMGGGKHKCLTTGFLLQH
jgi:hypothetical protein